MNSTANKIDDQLALASGLTAKTNQLCLGLESGAADILELVTPTTADLLAWWFGEDMVMARGGSATGGGGLNFHAGQKQAILNAIVAHEVLGAGLDRWTLLDLYRAGKLDLDHMAAIAHPPDRNFKYWLIAPAVFLLLAVGLFPLIYSLVVSFMRIDMMDTDTSFAGLHNYKLLFKDARLWQSLAHTLLITAVALPGPMAVMAMPSARTAPTSMRRFKSLSSLMRL